MALTDMDLTVLRLLWAFSELEDGGSGKELPTDSAGRNVASSTYQEQETE